MSLVNCFVLPPKHGISKGTIMTLYCPRLSRNSNASCWYFPSFLILFLWMFDSYGHGILTTQIIFFDLSSKHQVRLPHHVRCPHLMFPAPEEFISIPLDHSSFRPVFICWKYAIGVRTSDHQHL